jgi:hypothetical protein
MERSVMGGDPVRWRFVDIITLSRSQYQYNYMII